MENPISGLPNLCMYFKIYIYIYIYMKKISYKIGCNLKL